MTIAVITLKIAKCSMRVCVVSGAILGFILCPTVGRAAPNTANAAADADWIMGAVINGGQMNGAIGLYPDSNGMTHIRPYQANLACLGLARATAVTGNHKYVDAVWSHLQWYAGHMDKTGYVHDWDQTNGTWVQGGFDSTDAYAATFLLAVRAAYSVDPDRTKLQNINWGIQVAINAIYTTQQSDGMTWASPSWHVKLLEDNVETYQGELAGSWLAEQLGLTSLSGVASGRAQLMASGIATLWDSATNNYYWAKHENGFLQTVNWSNVSPDAMEEIWPVSYRVADGMQATGLLDQLNKHQPNWDQPSKNGGNYDVVPIGWGYYNNGQEKRAQEAAASIRSAAIAANRAWPFTPEDCGALIILETDGESLIF